MNDWGGWEEKKCKITDSIKQKTSKSITQDKCKHLGRLVSVCQSSPHPNPTFIHRPARALGSPPCSPSPQLPRLWLQVGLGQTGAPPSEPGGRWLHPPTAASRSCGPLPYARAYWTPGSLTSFFYVQGMLKKINFNKILLSFLETFASALDMYMCVHIPTSFFSPHLFLLVGG